MLLLTYQVFAYFFRIQFDVAVNYIHFEDKLRDNCIVTQSRKNVFIISTRMMDRLVDE